MGIFEILLTAIGLSMDALAVSVCKGLSMKKVHVKNAAIIALFFGGFQALMPFLGWILGVRFKSYIEAFDHWIAFILLLFIGGKMILDCLKEEPDTDISKCDCSEKIKIKEMTLMAIATSIDALAVGIAMAVLEKSTNILGAITIIGAVTFALCLAGVYIGNKFGNKFEKNAQFAGGVILILIGIKILLEHLGILGIIFS